MMICSRVHMNDENPPTVTWANTFVRVNYDLCQGFQCHANQTCLILGKVFKMPRGRKRRPAAVDLD